MMARLNVLLLLAVVGCALAVITGQHQARRLFSELEREQERMRQLEVEWGQLQLERRTWANHGRVEQIARDQLKMRAPDPRGMVVVEPAGR